MRAAKGNHTLRLLTRLDTEGFYREFRQSLAQCPERFRLVVDHERKQMTSHLDLLSRSPCPRWNLATDKASGASSALKNPAVHDGLRSGTFPQIRTPLYWLVIERTEPSHKPVKTLGPRREMTLQQLGTCRVSIRSRLWDSTRLPRPARRINVAMGRKNHHPVLKAFPIVGKL